MEPRSGATPGRVPLRAIYTSQHSLHAQPKASSSRLKPSLVTLCRCRSAVVSLSSLVSWCAALLLALDTCPAFITALRLVSRPVAISHSCRCISLASSPVPPPIPLPRTDYSTGAWSPVTTAPPQHRPQNTLAEGMRAPPARRDAPRSSPHATWWSSMRSVPLT